jgi:hypothetical protein
MISYLNQKLDVWAEDPKIGFDVLMSPSDKLKLSKVFSNAGISMTTLVDNIQE